MTCPKCKGQGCLLCDGSGAVCDPCKGQGIIDGTLCEKCDGTGSIPTWQKEIRSLQQTITKRRTASEWLTPVEDVEDKG